MPPCARRVRRGGRPVRSPLPLRPFPQHSRLTKCILPLTHGGRVPEIHPGPSCPISFVNIHLRRFHSFFSPTPDESGTAVAPKGVIPSRDRHGRKTPRAKPACAGQRRRNREPRELLCGKTGKNRSPYPSPKGEAHAREAIVGGNPAPTFNATFSLSGQVLPEPASLTLLSLGLAGLAG
jgi:hypothetical protein